MPENSKPVRVAVNVMRSRLTVIGFNIAIVSFQIAQLYKVGGGITVPGLDYSVHVKADMALFMALALSLFAIVLFIMSCKLDEVGYCTHWTLVAGDLLMYLALANTLAGFFQPWNAALEILAAKLPAQAAQIAFLHTSMAISGGAAWFMATYAGPVVALVRSPFDKRVNIALTISYLILLLLLCWVHAQAGHVEAAVTGEKPGMIFSILRELVQPFQW